MSSNQNITDNIKAPNKDIEVLKKNFSQCFDKDGKFQLEKFKNSLSENEINFSTESYGLDWLGKSYARLLASDPATTLLKADEIHNSKPENANSENLLIKGDNLEVLKHLANAYYEQVKMIYIDPPYNTGGDGFLYQDDRKFTAKELQQLIGIDEEKAKRILDFTQSKSNSHSAWLTFMYPRLYIAKQLLKDDGVIFISIDDNEFAQLRMLMNEIFGEENFVAEFIWKCRNSLQHDEPLVSKQTERIVLYAANKSIWSTESGIAFNRIRKPFDTSEYNNPDNDPRGPWLSSGKTRDDGRPSYTVISPKGIEYTKPWIPSPTEFKKWEEEGLIWWGKEGTSIPRKKAFLKDFKGNVISDILFDEYTDEIKDGNSIKRIKRWEIGTTESGTKGLKELFDGKSPFDYPKPWTLIKYLATISTNHQEIILDFFAGSGTTGEAIIKLNADDGGKRKYVLVQLPEQIDPKKNKFAYNFVNEELKAEPTIFEITKERIKRASKRNKESIAIKIKALEKEIKALDSESDLKVKDEKINQIKAEIKALKEQDLGFKIFETTPIWEDYNFEAELFDKSQTLFDAGKLTEDDIKAILTTWKTYDGIFLTQDLENIDLNGYTSYYGNGKLYLMDKGFTTDHLKALLEKIDSDKKFNPTSIVAFGYHFESKNLRELSENVKSYGNKKHIDIDFITRY